MTPLVSPTASRLSADPGRNRASVFVPDSTSRKPLRTPARASGARATTSAAPHIRSSRVRRRTSPKLCTVGTLIMHYVHEQVPLYHPAAILVMREWELCQL